MINNITKFSTIYVASVGALCMLVRAFAGLDAIPDWFKVQPYRPPDVFVGEASDEALFCAVGKVCTAWELLEGRLSSLFSSLLQNANTDAAPNWGAYSALYGSQVSSAGRRDLILGLCSALYPKEAQDRQDIKRVLDLAGRAVGRRNQIAHGVVKHLPHISEGRPYYLIPPEYSPIDMWDQNQYPNYLIKYQYNASTLNEFVVVFDLIKVMINSIDQKIGSAQSLSIE